MSLTKEYYYDELDLSERTDHIELFTNVEARPQSSDANWYFKAYGGNQLWDDFLIEERTGNVSLPDCIECDGFGDDLNELHSALEALKWVRDVGVRKPVRLWMSAERIVFDRLSKKYRLEDGRFRCPTLRKLRKEVDELLCKFDVDVEHYGYGNKDMIPVWFF